VLYATSHSYGASQNSTIRNFVLPGPISIKLGVIDYVGDPYLYANFGWIWLGGKFPANTWNITSVWLFVVSLFFVHSPVTKTRERICTINGLKRVKSGKDVPFGGFDKKIFTPTPISPKFRKFCITKAVFRAKHV